MKLGTHSSKVYDEQLRALHAKLLLLASLVEEMIGGGSAAYFGRDTDGARATIRLDRRINRLACEVDALAMQILATRQPVASDLRFLTVALKVTVDLERMGDLCVNVCQRVIELNEETPLEPTIDLTSMVNKTAEAVRAALHAFASNDAAQAAATRRRDATIDAEYDRVFYQILERMACDPGAVYRATRVQSIAKYLERIADHAALIAERVIFLEEGRDVRREEDEAPPSSLRSRRVSAAAGTDDASIGGIH